MPRFESGDADGGLKVAGIYQELLDRERVRCETDADPRWVAKFPDQEVPSRYRRPRGLLDALEAGVDVIVSRSSAQSVHGWRFRFPWDRSVDSVRVSSDDVVRPSDSEHPWYGRADDPSNYAAPSANTIPQTIPFQIG